MLVFGGPAEEVAVVSSAMSVLTIVASVKSLRWSSVFVISAMHFATWVLTSFEVDGDARRLWKWSLRRSC